MENINKENVKKNSFGKMLGLTIKNILKFIKKFIILILLCGLVVGGVLLAQTDFYKDLANKYNLPGKNSNVINQNNNTNNGYNTVNISEYSNTSEYVAQNVLPSIVGVEVEYTISSIIGGSSTANGSGSGIILSENGYILTNSHVIKPEESRSRFYTIDKNAKIIIKLNNDEKVNATVVGIDELTDLAVLKIDKTGLTPAKFGNSDNIKVGQYVMALGNPLGLNGTVTTGIVSSKDREISLTDGSKVFAIQTDASINQGNSGGALANSNAEVIGINTLKFAGSGIEGIGFAIPTNLAKNIAEKLIKDGKITRTSLGISGIPISEDTAQALNIKGGIIIRQLVENGSAKNAGLHEKDIIVKFNNKEITDIADINSEKNNIQENQEVDVEIIRSGQRQTIKVKMLLEQNTTTTSNDNVQTTQQQEQQNTPNTQNRISPRDFFSMFGN